MEYNKSYSDFIKSLDLKQIYLKSMDVGRTTKYEIPKVELQFELGQVTHFLESEKRQLRYEVKIRTLGYGDEGKTEIFHINIAMEVVYILTTEIDVIEDYLVKYEKNAIFNVWPYIRNTIHDISKRMELNLPPVPLFKISTKD